MTTRLDLRRLAVDRSPATPVKQRRRRAIISRWLVPAAILLGFLGMISWAARERFVPMQPVTVVPVIVTRAELQQAGTPLFQAAGWIEPRPTPVLVSALAEGVIQELLVVEGQAVQAGEPIARLIDTDSLLNLEQAEADLDLRRAETDGARAELESARLRFKYPVHLQAAVAEAESLLAKTETELAKVPFLTQAAEARVQYSRQNFEGKKSADSAVAERLIQQAQSEYEAALADMKELQGRGPRLEREAEALRRKQDALGRQLELLIEESRQVADAEARLKAAEARERQARLAVKAAQLRLERMVIRSPMQGRVLSLVATRGSRVMGLDPAAEYKSNVVVTLYDPDMLQVRADVRLEDVPLVEPGQPVAIETASAKEPLQGVVLSATSTANIQKNTLEVKVAITSPPATVRPEMLVTATFLAPARPTSGAEASEQQERLLVPRQLVESPGEGSAVWIADAEGLARRKSIRLGQAGTEDLVEVVEGLRPTDKLITGGREGLRDGDRITIAGEDASLGLTVASGTDDGR